MMKRLKRLTCTLAAIATLIWTCPPAQAEYKGELGRDIEWVINFDNSASAGKTAVTVHYLVGRSGDKDISRDEVEIEVVEAGARTQLIFSKPGKGVRRIIIEVDQPTSVTIDVEVSTQNASFPHRFFRPGSLVFDVVD